MSLLKTVEHNIQQYWSQQESTKTADQWIEWLSIYGIVLQSVGGSQEKINYQQFIAIYETQLQGYSHFLDELSSPEWLSQQQIIVLPKGSSPSSSSKTSLEQQLQQLNREIQGLKRRITTLEAQPASAPMYSAMEGRSRSQGGGRLQAMGNLQVVDKEMTLERLSKKKPPPLKKKEKSKTPDKFKKKDLQDIYFSFNEWCSLFEQEGLDLQGLSSKSIRVEGSHRISFNQFEKRVARSVGESKKLSKMLESFEKQYQGGVDPDVLKAKLEGKPIAEPAASSRKTSEPPPVSQPAEVSGFQEPDIDQYLGYNQWLTWLLEQGIDIQQYASEDLAVESSHRISFPQFCKRVERKLSDVEGFQKAIGK